MKITLVGPVYPYRGGIAQYTALLAQAIGQQNEVQVFSFRRQYPGRLYPGQTDQDPSQQVIKVTAAYTIDPFYPWTWEQTTRQIVAAGAEAVIFQWWTTFWAPAYAYLAFRLRHLKLHTIFLIHNVLPHEPRFFDAFLARAALAQASACLVQTSAEKERLLALLPSMPVELCRHPVYDFFSSQRLSKEEARARLDLPLEASIILAFGLVRPYKGLQDLIEALAMLANRGVKPHLLIAGEFWENEALYRQQIERLGLSAYVHIYNRYIPNEEVALYFSAADLCAAPYRSGTQSGAVKIAMGFDLPLVACPPALDDGLQGSPSTRLFIAPPANPPALADALFRALETIQPGSPTHSPAAPAPSWQDLAGALSHLAMNLNQDMDGVRARAREKGRP